MTTAAVRSRLVSEIAARTRPVSADEINALASVLADTTASRFIPADVVALQAAVAAIRVAYDAGTILTDVLASLVAAEAASTAATTNKSAGGV